MMKTWADRWVAVLVAITLLVVALTVNQARADVAHGTPGWCVSGKVASVHATYCRPWRGAAAVDVMTHGATYTGSYWAWPQHSPIYSYVDKTLRAGRATLTYDRVNSGPSTAITMESDALVLHRLIVVARLLGHRHVNSIGHSYGSGVALAEAVAYGDVDALVLTGYLHRPSNPAVTAGNYPANQDPKFADLGLDSGWLTSRPGVRGASFHSPSSDPDVVAFDEQQKDLVSLTGLLGFLAARGVPPNDNISRLVDVPVLVVAGQQDAIFCYQPVVFDCADQAAVAANEAPFYRDVTTRTIPGAGHSLTLHPADSFNVIDAWLRAS